jgi:hypothetical protein
LIGGVVLLRQLASSLIVKTITPNVSERWNKGHVDS